MSASCSWLVFADFVAALDFQGPAARWIAARREEVVRQMTEACLNQSLDALLSRELLMREDYELVVNQATRTAKVRKLLDTCERHSEEFCRVVVRKLQDNKQMGLQPFPELSTTSPPPPPYTAPFITNSFNTTRNFWPAPNHCSWTRALWVLLSVKDGSRSHALAFVCVPAQVLLPRWLRCWYLWRTLFGISLNRCFTRIVQDQLWSNNHLAHGSLTSYIVVVESLTQCLSSWWKGREPKQYGGFKMSHLNFYSNHQKKKQWNNQAIDPMLSFAPSTPVILVKQKTWMKL